MAGVVFLDRDGVINKERGEYTYTIADFDFVDGLFDALNQLKEKGFGFIVITNQGGISKQIYNHSDVISVHKYMQEQLVQAGINLIDVYYCPHHSDIEQCICRKPDSLMLEKAIAKHKVNIDDSYFVGDSDRDVEAAEKVGLTAIKVNANDSLVNYLDQF